MIIGHSMTDKKELRKIIIKEGFKVYFIGIGGISMSALAEISLERTAVVYGSDIRKSDITERLRSLGAKVRYTQSRANIMEAMPSLVVYSLSISENNPEYVAAKVLGIPTVSRAEYLGVLMESYSFSVGVSGSHGKSTVTAMLGSALSYAGMPVSILCGAEISKNSGYISGGKEYLVYEACEYGDSFLKFSPDIQILLNLDFDHPDYFKDIESLKESFIKAANTARELVIINSDDSNLKSVLHRINVPTVLFSEREGVDYRYVPISHDKGRFTFDLYFGSERLNRFNLAISGRFNIPNAVSAVIAAEHMGVPAENVALAIESFLGIGRRLEYLKKVRSTDVYYDYAHHPCEIKATCETLKSMGYSSVCAVFSPHTYSRTKALFFDFVDALSLFDKVYITDIYGARESAVVGVSSVALSEAVRGRGKLAVALADDSDIENALSGAFDCLVLMGAGDLERIKKKIIDK